MNRTGIIIAGVLQLSMMGALGQKTHSAPPVYHAAIRVLARAYGDSIVIRWAPTAAWAWSGCNVAGYTIERIEISAPGNPRQKLNPQPLRPLTLDQFKASFGRDDKYAAIAAQCLYGTNFTTGIRKGYAGQGDQASVFGDRYGFALQVADYDGKVAQAEALRWTDRQVKPGGVYAYIVYPGSKPPQGKIDTGGIIITDSAGALLSKPRLSELVPGDRIAEVHWSRFQKEPYSGYYIDRSDDGQHFQPVNALPFYSSVPDSSQVKKDTAHARQYALLRTKQVFVDSLPRNYRRYYFRIRGINAFAEMSDYSDTLTVTGLDLTPPSPPIVGKPQYLGKRSFRLTWKRTGKETDFAGWMVTKARQVGGPYSALTPALLAADQTSLIDTGAFAHGQTYYIVAAVDTAGNMGVSMAAMALVPDTTPPAAPAGLKGRINRNGLVFLSWNRNSEEDMKGYKVYFANGDHHYFSQITLTPDTDTSFVDSISLRTLTKYIWYEVVAVDQNNNHSKYSLPVKLKKPDIVPPVPPVASRVLVDSAGAHIDWIRSPGNDVVSYILYRRQGDTIWRPVARIGQDTTKKGFRFTDSTMKPFTPYQYCAEAVDEDSLHSVKSVVVSASVNTAPPLPPLKTLTAAYDGKQVNLKWQYKGSGSYYFILYRGMGAAALSRFHSVSQADAAYADTPPTPLTAGGQIRYAIQVLYRDGQGKTRVSDPVTVKINP
jgi:fibronectin type 3 domain-containing protein